MSTVATVAKCSVADRATPARRLLEGAGWSMAGAAAGQACVLLASVGIARVLGAERFGVFAFVQNTVNTAANLAAVGLGLTAMRYLPVLRREDPGMAASVLALARRSAAVAGLLAAATLWLFGTGLGPAGIAGAFLLAGTVQQASAAGALLGLEQFAVAAQLNALRGVLMALLGFIGALVAGETAALGGLLAAVLVVWVTTERTLRRACRRCGLPAIGVQCTPALPLLWKFSLPALANSLLAMPVHWAAQAFVLAAPGGLAENGLLQAATVYRNAATFLPTQAGQAALPLISAAKESRERRGLTAWSTGVALATAVPVTAAVYVGRETLMAWFGPGFSAHSELLLWTAPAGLLISLSLPASQVLAASGRMWICAAIQFLWAALLLALAWTGLRAGEGAVAVVRAYVVAYAIYLVLNWAAAGFFALRPREVYR